MIHVSELHNTPPSVYQTPLQSLVYKALEEMNLEYVRVDNDPAITMDDCDTIDAHLGTKMVKTLLVCNRQQTSFYLFVTPGHKPFSTKDFGHSLQISRVSFASEDYMKSLLGTERGAATIFSVLLDSSHDVKIVIDSEVLSEPYYGCSDGTTTSYLRLPTKDLIPRLESYTHRSFIMVHTESGRACQ